jgi:hypothetical protein
MDQKKHKYKWEEKEDERAERLRKETEDIFIWHQFTWKPLMEHPDGPNQ